MYYQHLLSTKIIAVCGVHIFIESWFNAAFMKSNLSLVSDEIFYIGRCLIAFYWNNQYVAKTLFMNTG